MSWGFCFQLEAHQLEVLDGSLLHAAMEVEAVAPQVCIRISTVECTRYRESWCSDGALQALQVHMPEAGAEDARVTQTAGCALAAGHRNDSNAEKCAHCRSSGAACCAGPGAASPCYWAVMPPAPGPPPATSHKSHFFILAFVDTGLLLKLEQEVALCIRSASPQRCITCQPRGCIKVRREGT